MCPKIHRQMSCSSRSSLVYNYNTRSIYISQSSVSLSVCLSVCLSVGPPTLQLIHIYCLGFLQLVISQQTVLSDILPIFIGSFPSNKVASLLFSPSNTKPEFADCHSLCPYKESSSNLVPKVIECSHFNSSACGFIC